MKVSFRRNVTFPQLAWIAEVDRANQIVSAHFGDSVECGRDFIVAGVWNGPFGTGDFATTDCFFGTGFVVREDCVIFVPSGGIIDPIYYSESRARLVATNSLPLLLAAIDDQLDPQFAYYDRITDSIQAGIDAYEQSIPTERGQVLWVFFRNLKVMSARIEQTDKRRPPAFRDYASYLRYLTANYANIYDNIRDPNRRHRLDIVSTQSRGYDTTAVNTIASKYEIDNVFTVAEAKENGAFVGTTAPSLGIDDGSNICEALGLKATRLDRHVFTRSFSDEYLFYSAAHQALGAGLLGMKSHLRRVSVMLTGLKGDVVWATDKYYGSRPELLMGCQEDRKAAYPGGTAVCPELLTDDLRGPDTWLQGLSELCLEWGLIQFSPAFIGSRNRPDIFRITMSEEMEPWRLGNEYDRPIARRIAEEIGGIPRNYFGYHKMAIATEFPWPPVPIGSKLRREYFRFLREHHITSLFWSFAYQLVHRINARVVFHTPHRYRYIYYIRRLLSKLVRRNIEIPILYRHLNGRLYCFCANKRAKEYAEVLRGAGFGGQNPCITGAPGSEIISSQTAP